jgi:hypothetical protein
MAMGRRLFGGYGKFVVVICHKKICDQGRIRLGFGDCRNKGSFYLKNKYKNQLS